MAGNTFGNASKKLYTRGNQSFPKMEMHAVMKRSNKTEQKYKTHWKTWS
jgi:hypothetical protein